MRRVLLGPLTEEDTVRLVRSLASPEREGEGEETVRLERLAGGSVTRRVASLSS
jgi:hypothetical protein